MLAFCLSIGLFLFWGWLGYSVLCLLNSQRNVLQNALIAPTVGFAITLLLVLSLNKLGLPIQFFSKKLIVILVIFAVIVSIWKRPIFPYKKYVLFAVVLVGSFIYTGWPMFKFGFNWLSYTNDDMANYCLGALRFMHHGYYELPNLSELIQGKDYSSYFWFMHAVGLMRPGGELILAWLSSLTGLMPDQIFMPLMMTFHICVLSVTAGLIYQGKKNYSLALAVITLLGLSAYNSLGTYYQLIAQVGGVALLVASILLLLRPLSNHNLFFIFRYSALIAVMISALAVFYPELLPFLALSWFFYQIIVFLTDRQYQTTFLLMSFIAAVFCILLLNTHLINVLFTLYNQAREGMSTHSVATIIFPFFLIPSGLAVLWGFDVIATGHQGLGLSLRILAGALLLGIVLCRIFKLTHRAYAFLIPFLVMLGLGILLFFKNADFGLFKLTMYMQPFLFCLLVAVIFTFFKNSFYRYVFFAVFILMNIPSSIMYANRSTNQINADIPMASATGINQEFKKLLQNYPTQSLLMDTNLIVLAKYQSLYQNGRQMSFPSRGMFETLLPPIQLEKNKTEFGWAKENRAADEYEKNIKKTYQTFDFQLFDTHGLQSVNHFRIQNLNKPPEFYVGSSPRLTILNRWKTPDTPFNFSITPINAVHNKLIFIHSTLGQHYYLGEKTNVSLNQLESDWFYPEQSFSGIARHLLFEVINPSKPVRLILNFTASLNGDGENKLPPVAVIGAKRYPFHLLGRGSARVISEPLAPQIIAKNNYLAIDMGANGHYFKVKRNLLMKLYGKRFLLDIRPLLGFARDISAISEEQYQQMTVPTEITTFPTDLMNPNVEYSGIYEDGWIAENAYVVLKRSAKNKYFNIQGNKNNHIKTILTVLMDGKEIGKTTIQSSMFNEKFNLPETSNGRTKITLKFSSAQSLSNEDKRKVACKLLYLGFITK